ncbi:hypothetical protein [Marinobacter sp. X15-166B]|uniref:hypothetical protein n=1 Tax=Marinobacter sp. X15-166B TaxID=1897620 RepID=UPI00085C733F|nr:hypothetical protein [Marinobacter sp. X15-166B]OEY65636.1 hypothetical protein BG841_03650 [Marinobacter sp. X15-166B]
MATLNNVVLERIYSDHPPEEMAELAIDIATVMHSSYLNFKSRKFYFQHIANRLDGKYSNTDILNGLIYLSKKDIGYINLIYEFLDDNLGPLPLESSDVNEAIEQNHFIHPIKGIEVQNFKSHIFLVYEIKDELSRN